MLAPSVEGAFRFYFSTLVDERRKLFYFFVKRSKIMLKPDKFKKKLKEAKNDADRLKAVVS